VRDYRGRHGDRRTPTTHVRVRENFIDIVRDVMRERGVTSYEQVGKLAGLRPHKAGKAFKSGYKYGQPINSVIQRLRLYGKTTVHRETAEKLEAWLGCSIHIDEPKNNGKETMWLEVTCANGRTSTDIIYHSGTTKQSDIQQLCETDGDDRHVVEQALIYATMWAERMGISVDNMTRFHDLNLKDAQTN